MVPLEKLKLRNIFGRGLKWPLKSLIVRGWGALTWKKKLSKSQLCYAMRREIKICRLFVHPHVIRLYEIIETPPDIHVIMEHLTRGELFDYIVERGKLQENEARHFFQQIIAGVEYCHRNMVVHRDLKPENLLLGSKGNVEVADFGLSNIMWDGHFLRTSCGSPNYAAPEVVSGKLYAGPEIDIWSCGVILYALVCGALPFDDENIPNLFKKIKLDEEIILEVLRLGFDRRQLIDSLEIRLQNDATVAYYLLLDKQSPGSTGYLGANFQESVEICSVRNNPDPNVQAFRLGGSSSSLIPRKKQWVVGLQSPSHPQEIMAQILGALQGLNVRWKKIGHYNMKCLFSRSIHNLVSNHMNGNHSVSGITTVSTNVSPPTSVLKFEIQVYKTSEVEYLLDQQRLSGPVFLFLDLCAYFMMSLHFL